MPYLGHPLRVVAAVGQTIALGHLFWRFGYSFGEGSGPSMLPTFAVAGETLVVDKSFRRGRGVRVGDCVDFRIPVDPVDIAVKRIMGLPGDYVLVNTPGSGNSAMMQVPQGHCYLVGDNHPWSRDSRDYGPVPLALINGKVVAKMTLGGWDPRKWFTRLENGLTPVDPST